jgi:class 3 adenylate cyclase
MTASDQLLPLRFVRRMPLMAELAIHHRPGRATNALLSERGPNFRKTGVQYRASADRRLRFRIGLHRGDVVEKPDGSIYGDGVNIAARLQMIAAPGAVVASESLRLAVRGTLRAAFEPLGEQHLKNVGEPVTAHRVVTGSAPELRRAAAPSSPAASNTSNRRVRSEVILVVRASAI